MAHSPENQPNLVTIPLPVQHDPEDLVENVFRIPGTSDLPDLRSQDITGEYLIDRFIPEEGPKTRIVWTETGHTIPALKRVPDGFKEVTKWRKTQPKEWLKPFTPRNAAAVVLGSMAPFNIVSNYKTIDGATRYEAHAVHRLIDPIRDKTVFGHDVKETPGRISHIDVEIDTSDQSGSIIPKASVVRLFVNKVEHAEQHRGTVRGIEVTGNTSDEWATDSSIGTVSAQNTQLGTARADAAAEALVADGLKLPKSDIHKTEKEHVLSPSEKTIILKQAQADGYPTIESAINAVDTDQPTAPRLTATIKRFFTSKKDRGVSLSATVQFPGKEKISSKTVKHVIPGVDNTPNIPRPHWYWFLPMLPIRRRESYVVEKQRSHWEATPARPIMKPEIIREDQEQVWLRIRPEAVKEDGTLKDAPWAYTGKYEHLLRDDRIVDLLRADYESPTGEQKSLRVMFIDKVPEPETVTAFEKLLSSFANMEDGALSDRVSGIFVYPSESAGTEHGEPKQIAMGIDKQSDEHILGTFTYALDLVELHMPTTTVDPAELRDMFRAYNGPGWVAAHEVAGHGTDESDAPLKIRRVKVRGIPNAHVIDGDPRAMKMLPLKDKLRTLPKKADDKQAPILFDIEYQVPDKNGEIVTMRQRVTDNDPRLAHASQATIVGHEPTQYASANVSEHYAETAAAVTTGIVVPFVEASLNVPLLTTDTGKPAQFVVGYRPDTRGQKLFSKSVGSQTGSYPATFTVPSNVRFTHINPVEDPVIQKEVIRARNSRSLLPEEKVAILARVARRSMKSTNE